MALFDTGGDTLESVLGQQANDQVNTLDNVYAKKRRQSIAQAGATGRLRSGVYNYTAGDINAGQAADTGDIYSNLASALGQVPINDYTSAQDDARKRQLAELIASLNSPSTLQEVLGGVSTIGNIAAQGAGAFKG